MESRKFVFRQTGRVAAGQAICTAAMIAVFALTDRLGLQLLGLLLINSMMESALLPIFGIPVSVQLFAVFALIPIALYSGQKCTRSRVVQWGFYLFYPLHLLILWIILRIIP